jgi:hypothetical protein
MPREFQVTFDAADPIALSRFWAEALDYVIQPPPHRALEAGEDPFAAWEEFLEQAGVPEAERDDASAVVDPDGDGPRVYFQKVPEPKTAKNRVHLDLRVAAGLEGDERMAALEAECARLVDLGARRVARHEPAPPMSAGFIVMADPEGNEFCLD